MTRKAKPEHKPFFRYGYDRGLGKHPQRWELPCFLCGRVEKLTSRVCKRCERRYYAIRKYRSDPKHREKLLERHRSYRRMKKAEEAWKEVGV